MLAVTLRPSILLTILAVFFRPASASPLPDRNAPFLFRRSDDTHGLTGGQIVIIASVAILGVVALSIAGIVGCYLCAKIEYQDRQRRREMGQEEQGLMLEEQDAVDHLPSPFADSPRSPAAGSSFSGLSGSTAYVSLPENPPQYTRDTPLEILRTKNFLFNHNK